MICYQVICCPALTNSWIKLSVYLSVTISPVPVCTQQTKLQDCARWLNDELCSCCLQRAAAMKCWIWVLWNLWAPKMPWRMTTTTLAAIDDSVTHKDSERHYETQRSTLAWSSVWEVLSNSLRTKSNLLITIQMSKSCVLNSLFDSFEVWPGDSQLSHMALEKVEPKRWDKLWFIDRVRTQSGGLQLCLQ